jgi:PAS domain S-box-containing protein
VHPYYRRVRELFRTRSPSGDDERASIEIGFRWLLKALLVWVMFELLVGIPFFTLRKLAGFLLAIILLVTYLACLRLLSQGRYHQASWLFVSVTSFVTIGLFALGGGVVNTRGLMFLLVPIIPAGWLLGRSSALVFSALTLLVTLFAAILETFGVHLPNYFSGTHPVGIWLQFLGCVIMTVGPIGQVLQSLQDALKEYRSLVNSIDGMVWEADGGTFQFSFVSPSAERILGYPVERWLEEPRFWSDHIHPEDREWAVNSYVAATHAQKDHDFRYRMLSADGRIVWLHNIVTVMAEAGGKARLPSMVPCEGSFLLDS